jgi:hypothetical protein
MSVSKPLRYLFLVVFQWHVAANPTRNSATVPAVVVTLLLTLNVVVAIQLFRFFVSDIPLLQTYPDFSRLIGYVCYIVIGGIFWLSYVKNGAYRQFEAEFATVVGVRRKTYTLAANIYIVASCCLPVIFKVVLHKR